MIPFCSEITRSSDFAAFSWRWWEIHFMNQKITSTL